jgi:hypothetical protein
MGGKNFDAISIIKIDISCIHMENLEMKIGHIK